MVCVVLLRQANVTRNFETAMEHNPEVFGSVRLQLFRRLLMVMLDCCHCHDGAGRQAARQAVDEAGVDECAAVVLAGDNAVCGL